MIVQPLDGEFPIMPLVNSTLRAELHNKIYYTTLSLEMNYVANWLIGWPKAPGGFTTEWFTARDGYQKGWPTLGATCDASIKVRSYGHKLPLEVISSLIWNEMSVLADGDVGVCSELETEMLGDKKCPYVSCLLSDLKRPSWDGPQ